MNLGLVLIQHPIAVAAATPPITEVGVVNPPGVCEVGRDAGVLQNNISVFPCSPRPSVRDGS